MRIILEKYTKRKPALGLRAAALGLAVLLGGLTTACGEAASETATATPAASTSLSTSARPSATPEVDDYDPTASELGKSDAILTKTADAGKTYVDETLFLGDSNTVRYGMYYDAKGLPYVTKENSIGVVSMGAEHIQTLKCESFSKLGLVTMVKAVAVLQPKRILISFGTNDLIYSQDYFIETYTKALAALHESYPYADIVVCAVPPISQYRSNTRLSMTKVDEFNKALVKLCEKDGYKFLNTSEVLKDSKTGWAKSGYTLSDGVHLSNTAVAKLFDYIRTHAYENKDTRPKPLSAIPTIYGVPDGLLQTDPIAASSTSGSSSGAVSVPVEFVAAEGGSIQGSTSQSVAKGGTCSTVTAVPNDGYQFSYWSASIGSAGSGASLTFTVPGDADANGVIVTAHFEKNEDDDEDEAAASEAAASEAAASEAAASEAAASEAAASEAAASEAAASEAAASQAAAEQAAASQAAAEQAAAAASQAAAEQAAAAASQAAAEQAAAAASQAAAEQAAAEQAAAEQAAAAEQPAAEPAPQVEEMPVTEAPVA